MASFLLKILAILGILGSVTVTVASDGNLDKKPASLVDVPNCEFRRSSMEGEGVTLRCFVDGFPKPTVTWKRNGKEVSE
jgi:hypothetical protein